MIKVDTLIDGKRTMTQKETSLALKQATLHNHIHSATVDLSFVHYYYYYEKINDTKLLNQGVNESNMDIMIYA